MEMLWAPKSKHSIQQDKINEYLTKRLAELPKWGETTETTSESECGLKRGDTVKRKPPTELLVRAQMFGKTLGGGSVRKLGHHIGPVRNPTCTCEHCTEYFSGKRSRTRSVGDVPDGRINWKKQLTLNDMLKLESKNPNYSDF